MIRKEEVYCIGRLGKAHGVKGEVTFHFDDDVFDRTDADFLILETEGILVPFFIEEYRFRSDSTALMKFEGVDTQERARQLTGCDVYFPRQLAETDDDSLSWAQIIGFAMVDAATGQTVGSIASVDDSTENVLFCLEDGRLIPAAEELIVAVDTEKRVIDIELPEGILEL
ncbi:MAG: 16S rRNA processing protein RimM [Prevotella sp.]|nr:16S rRNA processing protein RimM [Prevotella sp.]